MKRVALERLSKYSRSEGTNGQDQTNRGASHYVGLLLAGVEMV